MSVLFAVDWENVFQWKKSRIENTLLLQQLRCGEVRSSARYVGEGERLRPGNVVHRSQTAGRSQLQVPRSGREHARYQRTSGDVGAHHRQESFR